jgi:hypothetical protein
MEVPLVEPLVPPSGTPELEQARGRRVAAARAVVRAPRFNNTSISESPLCVVPVSHV